VRCGGPAFIWAKDVPPARALPAVEDERIRTADGLAVSVSGQPQLSGMFLVGADGTITMPDVGAVRVVGMTPQAATEALTVRVATIIQTPNVRLVVAQRRVQVAILGEVRSPGK
jgi:polysaccharide export outer membrane protein